MGIQIDDDDSCDSEQTYYIWPECIPVWNVWHRLQTQWRIGMQGREGLDYVSVIAYLRDVARIKTRDFAETFACLQAMERACLVEWEKQQAKD
jgi:hypothetical protein